MNWCVHCINLILEFDDRFSRDYHLSLYIYLSHTHELTRTHAHTRTNSLKIRFWTNENCFTCNVLEILFKVSKMYLRNKLLIIWRPWLPSTLYVGFYFIFCIVKYIVGLSEFPLTTIASKMYIMVPECSIFYLQRYWVQKRRRRRHFYELMVDSMLNDCRLPTQILSRNNRTFRL